MKVSPVRRTVALLLCMLAASVLITPAGTAHAKGSPNTAALQVALKALHHYKGGIDGINGRRTKLAVRRYQRAHRLPVDGVAGVSTINSLKRGRGPRRSASQTVGSPSGPVRFLRPVRGVVTSPFGQRWGRLHAGIDFGAPTGAAVGAAGRGTVVSAGWNSGGYGNLVVIQHRLGFQTWYAHLSAVDVSTGQGVGGGTRIGAVGSTGASTGPHLHFEVRRNGTPVDPAPYLLRGHSVKRAKTQPGHEDEHPELCLPSGRVERDPARARLVDCRTGGRPAPGHP